MSMNQKWRGLLNGTCHFSFQDISYGGMYVHVCVHACVYIDRKKHREIKKHGTG